MLITELEKQIQKDISPDLSIRLHPNAEDIAGVYYKDVYLGVALPPVEIHEEWSKSYIDRRGDPYRNLATALNDIQAKFNAMTPEKYELLTTKD